MLFGKPTRFINKREYTKQHIKVQSQSTFIQFFKKENVESFTLLFTALGGADCFINYLILFV